MSTTPSKVRSRTRDVPSMERFELSSDMERGLSTNPPPSEQFDDIPTRTSNASRASTRETTSSDAASTVTNGQNNVAARPSWLHEDEHAESSTAAATRLPSEPPTALLLRGELDEEPTNAPTPSSDERPLTAARPNDHQVALRVRHTPAHDRHLLEAKQGIKFAVAMALGSAATTAFVVGYLKNTL